MFFISLAILIVALGASRYLSGRSIWFKYIFIFSIIVIFISNSYFSYQQYQTWLRNDVAKHLLPPYTSINYFIFYILTRFFVPYLISLAFAILFLLAAKILNKKYNERFFEPEEYYFGALAIFLNSHPGWLFYAVILLFVYLLSSICYLLFSRKQERLPLYHLWIPTAIFAILISSWLGNLRIWQLLRF